MCGNCSAKVLSVMDGQRPQIRCEGRLRTPYIKARYGLHCSQAECVSGGLEDYFLSETMTSTSLVRPLLDPVQGDSQKVWLLPRMNQTRLQQKLCARRDIPIRLLPLRVRSRPSTASASQVSGAALCHFELWHMSYGRVGQ